jgi:hypothetical protein
LKLNDHKLRTRFTLRDDAARGTPLELPRRNTILPGILVAGMFAVFAGVLVSQIAKLDLRALGSVFDLMAMLFELFFILGWSVGVLGLGALTVILLFSGESARLAGRRLIHVLNVGPIKMITEYDLARLCNLRVEADKNDKGVRVRFDYDERRRGLGDAMPQVSAERIVATLRGALPAAAHAPSSEFVAPPEPAPAKIDQPTETTPRPLPLASMLALIAANLVPLIGVLLGGWKLAEVMVLFWAESAVIGFYTLLKMAVVGKWLVAFSGLFFVGHFGGFMAVHFLFIYEMFVRGINARGPGPGAIEALSHLFTPLWPALLALFVSHGISFVLNFLARREYQRTTVSRLMAAPYGRIVMMQFTLIFGGWVVMWLKNPLPALVLLIVLKVAADLRAHFGERGLSINNNKPSG